MPKTPDRASALPTSRAEKMSILSAMLGPEAMARVREAQTNEGSAATPDPVEVDADRAAWHRNKLLERLRKQGAGTKPLSQTSRAEPEASIARRVTPEGPYPPHPKNAHLDARLNKIADATALAQEHPAVIARLIKTLPREERVEALKALPGPVARSIVKRLR